LYAPCDLDKYRCWYLGLVVVGYIISSQNNNNKKHGDKLAFA
jgi:hypothetical protein